jgi:hypothetical protein
MNFHLRTITGLAASLMGRRPRSVRKFDYTGIV